MNTEMLNGVIDNFFSDYLKDFQEGEKGKISYKKSHQGIYGTLQFPITKIDGRLLQEITYELYEELFGFISRYPGYQFVRIWNYVPFILKKMDQSAPDIEAYRCFNAGRYNAFQKQYGSDMKEWRIPAASAVGATNDVLSIEFFASDAPSSFFENKIQVPAYQYSEKYGKLPPVFTRGAVCELKDETLLFISGTASVVNEDTAYVDDICGQIQQTFRNISYLINASNLQSYGMNYEFALEDFVFLRVYYKNKSEIEMIKSEIKKIITTSNLISYVNTDICRKNLTIEIEGIGRKNKVEDYLLSHHK